MQNAIIKDIDSFLETLSVLGRFVNQLQFNIRYDETQIYCRNPQDFSTVKLYLYTNSMTLEAPAGADMSEESCDAGRVVYCLKDLTSLRSALMILKQTEPNKKEFVLGLDDYTVSEQVDGSLVNITYAKSVSYSGVSKFKLISVDPSVIDKYIHTKFTEKQKNAIVDDWTFEIDPVNLDILQNRTGNIVDAVNEVSVYILPDRENKKVVVDLATRSTDLSNRISLPVADGYGGDLIDTATNLPKEEICVHESAFRCFNMLKQKTPIHCNFINRFLAFFISSEVEKDGVYIRLTTLIQCIKGK